MNPSNYPVTSREYKLMLNVDRFMDRDRGAQVFLGLIEFLIKKAGGTTKGQTAFLALCKIKQVG